MIGEAGFRKAVRLERGVGRVVVYPAVPFAERVEKGPTVWVQWSLCEQEKIRGVLVQHRDDVDQGGAVGPCLLRVDDEEFEAFDHRGGGWSVAKSSVPISPGRGRETNKLRGRSDPILIYLG
jgi:hypothetical protein